MLNKHRLWRTAILAALMVSGNLAFAQRESAIQPPVESSQTANQQQYGRRFFLQLRSVFGRFRDADLQRVFESAQPIQCSELINEKGEWRTVAFFNERRELGDWYRSNFDEVKTDLSVYSFKGVCRGEHGPVQLTTKFPVTESADAYEHGKIPLDQVEVNVNAPVSAFYDPRSQAYTWDLPYLFLIKQQEDGGRIYSLQPPTLVGRAKYATDVVDHWECKSVSDAAVTYQFLICRSTTVPRDHGMREQSGQPAFGASAYLILSDGREASSSVKLSFGDDSGKTIEDASVPATVESEPPAAWEKPESDEKIVDLVRNEFRIRFAAEAWNSKVGSAQVLSAQHMTSLESSDATPGADYCIWLPGSAVRTLLSEAPDNGVVFALNVHDQDSQSSTSMTFEFNTRTGTHLGSLKCVFPHATSATSVAFNRWTSTVGSLLTFEIRP